MARFFDFEVSLRYIEPRIWRRFLLPEGASFLDLHDAIQIAGDWTNDHLFAFFNKRAWRDPICGGTPLGDPCDEESPSPGDVTLSSYFTRKGRKCVYVYDFGDSWELDVQLKGTVDSEEDFLWRLVGGARAFPPEDCGGFPGYYYSMVALGLEKDEGCDEDELEDRREWLGDWNPEDFDLERTKKEFDRPARGKRKRKSRDRE